MIKIYIKSIYVLQRYKCNILLQNWSEIIFLYLEHLFWPLCLRKLKKSSNIEKKNFRWVMGSVLCVTNVTNCYKTDLKLFFCTYSIYFYQYPPTKLNKSSNIENTNSRWVWGECYALQCYKCNKLLQNCSEIIFLYL